MKKISFEQKLSMIRRAIKSQKRRIACKEKLYDRSIKMSSEQRARFKEKRPVSFYREGRIGKANVGAAMMMPKVLCLLENYDETVEFLGSLRDHLQKLWRDWKSKPSAREQAIRNKNKGLTPYFERYWDFAIIEKLSAEVALIIASEFDVITRNEVGIVQGAIGIENWRSDVLALLDGIGFFELTKVDRPSQTILAGQDWKILRFKAGNQAEGAIVDALMTELGLPTLLNDPQLFDAIAEAITNTVQHAYKNMTVVPPHFSDWWMTGFIIPKERRVSISVWDRGLTIPMTLPSWERYPLYERGYRRLLGREPDPNNAEFDGTAIRIAMAIGRSSTKEAFRGKGLPLIESMVDLCAQGDLRIYSRRGSYERRTGVRSVATNRNSKLGGTLITWDWRFHEE